MLKKVVIVLDKIHEWSIKYTGSLAVVPYKDWITMKNRKVQLFIKIQSKKKLDKDVERVSTSYRHLFSGVESMIQLHGVPSIRQVRKVRKQKAISMEVEVFIDTYK